MVKFAIALLSLRAAADSPCGQGSSECDDSPGVFGECCIDQSTYCVAPRGTFVTSTCCPRWTVGCTVGSVGCCDPARPWQLLSSAEQPEPRPETSSQDHSTTGPTAYALFTGGLGSKLSASSIDLGNGQLSSRVVTGPAADWYALYFGESTRILPWDAVSGRFVFADADLSTGKQTVYTIDPSTGSSTGQEVSGCTGQPMGMAWDADLKALVVSTQTDAQASFFAVDPDTGAAKSLGHVTRGGDESSEAFYAGYLSHSHGGTGYRTGHLQVSTASGEGVGVTELPGSEDEGKSSWKALEKADAHGLPVSMQRHPDGGFVSLAPRNTGMLDMVAWDVNGTARVLAELGNANLPKSLGQTLGYVADAPVVDSVYAALTVSLSAGTMGLGDKWTVSSVSLETGALTEFALSPQPSPLGAETVSLAGFGLPAKTAMVV